jgi:hypothetical protein
VPDFDHTYISAISTIRYKHRNHPASPAPDSGHVAPPITLGQLDLPDICSFQVRAEGARAAICACSCLIGCAGRFLVPNFLRARRRQANFSVVAEEWGDVLKTRLSGGDGSEVIETVANLHDARFDDQNAAMAETYRAVFGGLFPYLETETPLDFNRCVTYRNHIPAFHGARTLPLPPLRVFILCWFHCWFCCCSYCCCCCCSCCCCCYCPCPCPCSCPCPCC